MSLLCAVVLIATKLTYGLDQYNKKYDLVQIEANRAALKWLAYQLLAYAHSPKEFDNAHLELHVTDDAYAVENDAVAVTIYLNEALSKE